MSSRHEITWSGSANGSAPFDSEAVAVGIRGTAGAVGISGEGGIFREVAMMKGYWLICCAVGLAGCGLIQQSCCIPDKGEKDGPETINPNWQECFKRDNDGAKGGPFEISTTATGGRNVSHSVYCLGEDRSKPPLILLHELPGLTPETFQYAEELSLTFTVYVPLLFGDKGQSPTLFNVVAAYRTILFGAEWSGGDQLDSTTPIVAWLQGLTAKIEEIHDRDQGIQIIGNCLTGILPLVAFDKRSDDRKRLLVLAQPSLPLKLFGPYWADDKSSLGVTKEEILKAQARRNQKLFWVRFEKDCISWPDKRKAIFADFPELIDRTICENEYDMPAHSVLIGEQFSANGKNVKVAKGRRDEVVNFLLDKSVEPNSQCTGR